MQLILSYWSETIFKLQAPVSWTFDPVCPPKIEVIYSPCPVTCKVLRSLCSYSQVIDLKLNSKCRPMTLNFDAVSPKTIQFIYKRCPTFLSTKYQISMHSQVIDMKQFLSTDRQTDWNTWAKQYNTPNSLKEGRGA